MTQILTSIHGRQLGLDKDGFLTSPKGMKVPAVHIGPSGSETALTATGAELNVLAGVTPGTATASKALVLNTSKGISTITSATITTLTATNMDGIVGATTPAAGTFTALTGNTSVKVGSGGTALTQTVVYSQTITPASVAAATVSEQTFTVTGLTTADKVFVNHAVFGNATGIAGVRVSAANTLAVSFVNPTAGALTPGAGTWNIVAIRS